MRYKPKNSEDTLLKIINQKCGVVWTEHKLKSKLISWQSNTMTYGQSEVQRTLNIKLKKLMLWPTDTINWYPDNQTQWCTDNMSYRESSISNLVNFDALTIRHNDVRTIWVAENLQINLIKIDTLTNRHNDVRIIWVTENPQYQIWLTLMPW